MAGFYLATAQKFGDSFKDQAHKLMGSLKSPPKALQP
jgi:hypothetical protein